MRVAVSSLILSTIVLAQVAVAQTHTWTGTVNTDWDTSGNWSTGTVPTSATPVVIPVVGSANYPTTAGVANAACSSLTLNNSASLTVATGTQLTVAGAATLNGTSAGGGTIRFTATSGTPLVNVNTAATVDLEFEPGTTAYAVRGTITGNLRHKAGAGLLTLNSSLLVNGLADFQGAGFQGGTQRLTVQDVNFNTTGVVNDPGDIFCSSNWTSNAQFQPTSDTVTFQGNTARTISTDPGLLWNMLTVAVGATITMPAAMTTLATRLHLTVRGTLNTAAIQIQVGGLLYVSGTMNATAATQLQVLGASSTGTEQLSVLGVLNTPNAIADITGITLITGPSGTQWTLGGGPTSPHRFSSNVTIAALVTMPALSRFQFTGTTGSPFVTANSPTTVDFEFEPGTTPYAVRGTITGNLRQKVGAGVLTLISTMQVNGHVDLQGAGFVGGGNRLTAQDVNFGTAGLVNDPGDVDCSGNWTSNAQFQPTSDTVTFRGATARTISTDPGLMWHMLTIDAGATITMPAAMATLATRLHLTVRGTLNTAAIQLQVGGLLYVSGTMNATAATQLRVVGTSSAGTEQLSVLGVLNTPNAIADITGVTLITGPSGTQWILGGGPSLPHRFSSNVNIAALVTMPAGSRFQFTGTTGSPFVTASSPTTVDFEFEPGTTAYTVRGTITGNLRQKVGAGVLTLSSHTQVNGHVDLQGAGFVGGTQRLTAHDVNFGTAGLVNDPGDVDCSGNWTSNAQFQPTTDTVTFQGATAQTISTDPGLMWHMLTIAAGATITMPTAMATLATRLDLTVRGTLATAATTVQVGNALVISSGGTLNATAATRLEVLGAANTVRFTMGQGTLNAPNAILTVPGGVDLGLFGTSTLTLGGGSSNPHRFGTGLLLGTLSTVTITMPAGSRFLFTGATGSQTITFNSPLNADVELEAGATSYTMRGTIDGNLRQRPGAGTVNVSSGLDVNNGIADFQGAGFSGASGVLTTQDVNFNTTGVVSNMGNNMFCRGNWTSNAQFQPTAGVVNFTGTGAQSLTASGGCIPNLTVATGSQLTVTSNLCVSTDVRVQGTLIDPVRIDVGRDLIVTNGTLDLQNTGTLAITRNITNTGGTYLNGGTLVMNGNGTVQSSTTSFRNLEVNSAAGTVTVVGTVPLVGTFTLTDGTIAMNNASSILRVQGLSRFLGGTVTGATGTLDLDGDAQFLGTSVVTNPPIIRCAGNWTADALSFQPTSGTVFFDGTGTKTINGVSGSPPEVRFWNVEVQSGTREPGTDLTLNGSGMTIGTGGSFITGGRRMGGGCKAFSVLGRMGVGAGGRLSLDDLSLISVAGSGTLSLAGIPGSPATITEMGGPGYRVQIAGTLEAQHYVLEGMSDQGVQLLAGARLGAAPNDGRFGTLRRAATASPFRMLDIAQPINVSLLALRFLTFDYGGTPSPGITTNVRATPTSGSTRIRMYASGNLAGATYEDDPASIVDWVNGQTNLRFFRATGRLGRIDLAFATSTEAEEGDFRIAKATSPSGPFTDLGPPITRQGSATQGASYALSDTNVTFSGLTRYYYRLEQDLGGFRMLLGTDSARPMPSIVGRSAFVGPGGQPSIPAALAAVGPGGHVVVTQGTYPAFTITQPVHILTDGSGPVVIDTTAGPVLVTGIPYAPSNDVSLYDLRIGTSGGSFGLRISNCSCPVILDRLTVTTAAAADAVLLDQCPRVAVQSCVISGGPGLRARASTAYVSSGSLNHLLAESASVVKYAGVVPGQVQVFDTSRADPLAGTMPSLDFSQLAASEKTLTATITGDPVSLFFVQVAFNKDFFDLSALGLPIDMVLLLTIPELVSLGAGVIGANGSADLSFPMPPGPELWGQALPLQAVTVPLTGRGRWTNVRDLLIVP